MTQRTFVAEQRKEDREPANGEVWFAVESPEWGEFRGRLIDLSKNGFRATHTNASLPTGQHVLFHHCFGEGRALVMWNRILDRHVETGFLVIGK